MILDVTDETLANVIADNHVVLVDFWASWCGPCKAMLPILESLSDQFGDRLVIAKVDTETEGGQRLVEDEGITSIPTMHLYVGGERLNVVTGARPRGALEALLSQHVVTDM